MSGLALVTTLQLEVTVAPQQAQLYIMSVYRQIALFWSVLNDGYN